MEYQNIFEALQKNEIRISMTAATSPLSLGQSKLGGRPHLPRDFAWPYFEGESYDGEWANRPLSFLMQINCKEIKAYDKENLLPATGMLYFFYEQATMTWGFDPADKGAARVFYYDVLEKELAECPFPTDLAAEYTAPELALTFAEAISLPSYEEFDVHCPNEDTDWDDYDEEAALFGADFAQDPAETVKLLGYAELVQGEMLWECEAVSRGYYQGGGPLTISKEETADMQEKSRDWTLLMQMGTVSFEGGEWMWGDCGCLYFYIRKGDLAEKNFQKVWMILQCG